MQSLDDRKMKILQAIIRNYLETGEPVGSRTISKYTDLNLSSATIRNEMADLEELGYPPGPYFRRQDSVRQRIPAVCGPDDGGKGTGGRGVKRAPFGKRG